MVDNPTFYALISPVPGLPEAKQRDLVAKYQPKEFYVVNKDGEHDLLVKLMRPGRTWVVAYTALLGEQSGRKNDRIESMIATKVAIHKRGGVVVEATTDRRSDKNWPAMRRDGEEMCRRLSQSAKNPFNARKGTQPHTFTPDQLRTIKAIIDSRHYKNWSERRDAMIMAGIDPVPGRTWRYTILPFLLKDLASGTAPTKLPRRRPSLVYFIQDGEKVKIGHSMKPSARVATLRTHSELTLIATMPGGQKRESELHKKFRPFRVPKTKEWFHFVPEIKRYIARHKRAKAK